MEVEYAKYFKKRFNKLPLSIRKKFLERLNIFLENQFDPSLQNHYLHGKYSEYKSINIIGDIRAIFKQFGDLARFEDIGSHSELYG